jgi:DNA-binding MarR family transcriptional regulator
MTSQEQIRNKWKTAVCAGNTGYLALPEVLLRKQAKLKITTTELTVLINILSFWWYEDRLPFPGNRVIADRMGVEPRTIQRATKSLESKGLIRREKVLQSDGQWRRYFDPSGLVKKLEEHAVPIQLANESRAAANDALVDRLGSSGR